MSDYNQEMQGENVRFGFVGSVTHTAALAVGMYDANFNPRILKPYERLIVDDIQGTVDNVPVAVFGSLTSTGTPVSSTIIGVLDFRAAGIQLDTKEGLSLPVGWTLWLESSVAGTSATLCAGSGRIVEGRTEGPRPSWRELTTPYGNF